MKPLPPRKVLLTGVTSIHGWPMFSALHDRAPGSVLGIRPPGTAAPDGEDVREACVTDENALRRLRDEFAPDVVIHAGGVCDLDVCEARPRWAEELNVGGTRTAARVFRDVELFVYCSTDLVYSGRRPPPNGYREKDPVDPISVVGRTYARAEREASTVSRHLILRLGLPLGASIQGDKGAVDWIESRFRRRLRATLFYDEVRSAIPCDELARAALEIVDRIDEAPRGVRHLGGERGMSIYDIGRDVLERGGYDPALLERRSRLDEIDGPPRIGDVRLDSSAFRRWSSDLELARVRSRTAEELH